MLQCEANTQFVNYTGESATALDYSSLVILIALCKIKN